MSTERGQYAPDCASWEARINAAGHETYAQGSLRYIETCPIHADSPVKICDGYGPVLECLNRREPCDRAMLIEALGLGESGPGLPGSPKPLRSSLIDWTGFANIPRPPPVIGGMLQARSLAWLYGKPGAGKTLAALDIAGCVSTGRPWHGREVRRGDVLYVVAEGLDDMGDRVRAWGSANDGPPTGVDWLTETPQAKDGRRWRELVELASDPPRSLIVIDTQALVTVGLDESSSNDMGLFVTRLADLRATGACVLTIHHPGHSGDHLRGSTVLSAAADTIIRVSKRDDVVTFAATKQRGTTIGDDVQLRMIPHEESVILVPAGCVGKPGLADGALGRLLERWREAVGKNPVTQADLVRATGMSSSSIARYVQALVNAGLVTMCGETARDGYKIG